MLVLGRTIINCTYTTVIIKLSDEDQPHTRIYVHSSTYFFVSRKNIYIEGIDTAVIRDVLIFTTPNKPIPDETAETEWALTARVYFDVARNDERGTLTLRRISPGMSNSNPHPVRTTVSLSSRGGSDDESQDIVIIIPVRPSINLVTYVVKEAI